MATVSVIVPLYNKARYIGRAIDSILAQTYQDFEVVVVDDGSTDDGLREVERVGDPRIRLIQQANAGPGAARNRGIRESTAHLVAFLDADDEWFPEFLAASVRRLEEHPECAVSASGYCCGSECASVEAAHRARGMEEGPWRLPPDSAPSAIQWATDACLSSVVARRSVLRRFAGFYDRTRCTYGEDTYLWLQVLLHYPVYRDPRPLFWYHSEASGLSLGRSSAPPPKPVVTDPGPIRERCPPAYRAALERVLAYYALLAARNLAEDGDQPAGRRLLRKFPMVFTWHPDYLRVRFYIALAPVVRWIRASPTLRRWARRLRDRVRRRR